MTLGNAFESVNGVIIHGLFNSRGSWEYPRVLLHGIMVREVQYRKAEYLIIIFHSVVKVITSPYISLSSLQASLLKYVSLKNEKGFNSVNTSVLLVSFRVENGEIACTV